MCVHWVPTPFTIRLFALFIERSQTAINNDTQPLHLLQNAPTTYTD